MKIKSSIINTSLILISILVCLVIVELSTWVYLSFNKTTLKQVNQQQEAIRKSFKNGPLFQSNPYLSYTPSDISINQNGCKIGYETFLFEKPDNTIRIACLGGSTTKNAYPKYLKEILQPSIPNHSIEIMDWGCPGWTMVESTLNYVLRVQAFNPDIVILHHGINDIAPRLRNNYKFDLSHYRRPFCFTGLNWSDTLASYSSFAAWMQLRLGHTIADLDYWTVVQAKQGEWINMDDFPVDETLRHYKNGIESIHHLTKAQETKLILAGMCYTLKGYLNEQLTEIVEQHNLVMKQYAHNNNLIFCDTQKMLKHDTDYFVDQCHLIAFGDEMKAKMIANAILNQLDLKQRLWISDSVDSKEDQSGESIEGSEMVINWNFYKDVFEAIHVYMQADSGKRQFLASSKNIHEGHIEWKPNNPRIDPQFISGPQPGHDYLFSAWPVSATGAIEAPITAFEPVKY